VVIADSVPTFMNPPNVVPSQDITPTNIKLTWSGISIDEHTGRDPPLYYELQWFNYETNTWDILTTPGTLPDLRYEFTFTRQTVFPSGSDQRFRLRA
jgi:hypothetical protein